MHYAAIRQPTDPTAFITGLRERMTTALPEPRNLAAVKDEVIRRWGTLDLLDMLKDADFRTELSTELTSVAPGR